MNVDFRAKNLLWRTAAAAVFFVGLILFSSEARAQVVYMWSGGDIVTGSITPTGVTTITSIDTLNIGTGADHDFAGRVVVNNGTVNWSAGRIRGGGALTNNAQWNDTASYSMNADFGPYSFVNSTTATYLKSTGNTTFNVGFVNSGIINVTGGILDLNAGGSFASGSVVGSSGSGLLELTAGNLSMSGTIAATNFVFNGGELDGTQTFSSSTLNWQNGTWNSAGTTTLASGTTLAITTGADHDFSGRAIINNGTVNWSTGRLRSGFGGSITNNAIWNDTAGYSINDDYGGTGGTTFTNAASGTYNKISNTTDFTIPFTNAGIINVSGGTLNLDAGGTFSNGSVIGSSGSGLLQLLGGTLTMTGSITATNFLFNGGNFDGNQTFTASTLNWQAGTWNSATTTTLGSGTVLSITGGSDHDFVARAIVNNGTVNWSAGRLRSGSGGTITNNAIWNDTAGYAINDDFGGTGGTTFINAATGSYNKTAGTTTFSVPFLNFGAVRVSGGTFDLDNGGTFFDGSSIGSTGTGVAQLTGGVLSAGGTGGFTATNFLLTSGQLSGNMTFLGTTNWVGSNFDTSGTATVGPTGILSITGGADHDFVSHAIVNNGIVNWVAGRLRSGSGGTITNNATWNDSASYAINNDFGGTGGTTFTNASTGVYHKTSGNTSIADNILVNNGTISVTGGQLTLGGSTFNSGSSIGSSGSGLVQLTSGILNALGTINVQNFLFNGGELTGNQTFVGSLSWLAGDFDTAFTTTIGAGSTFTIGTGADHDFVAHDIVNNGVVNWTAGRLRSGSGGVITNNGTWNDSAGYAINDDFGGTGGTTFVNGPGGTYNKMAGTTTISVPLTNAGTVNISSEAALVLTSTFTNASGTLALANGGTLSSSSPLAFGSGSILRGSGVVATSALTDAGGIFPGTASTVGSLTVNGGLNLLSTALTSFKLGGTTVGTGYDHLVVTGTVGLGGSLAVSFTGGFGSLVANGMTFNLVTAGTLTGVFGNVISGTRLTTSDGLGTFIVNYGTGSPFSSNVVELSGFVAVPEPSTWLMIVGGVGAIALTFRRRSRGGKTEARWSA